MRFGNKAEKSSEKKPWLPSILERERLMALYEISAGKSATKVGKETKRNPQTVMEWVHRYNQEGLAALKYQRTGGRTPFLAKQSKKLSEIELKKL